MKKADGLYANLHYLDERSRIYARLFAKAYPDLVKYASVVLEDEYGDTNYLLVEVPSPIELYERGILIVTNRHDLTVHFDYHHVHFGRSGQEPGEAFHNASEFIQLIMQEKVFIYVFSREGKWTGAGSQHFSGFATIFDNPDVIYTRSWRGTYDKRRE